MEGGNVDLQFIRSHLRAPSSDQMWMNVDQIHIEPHVHLEKLVEVDRIHIDPH